MPKKSKPKAKPELVRKIIKLPEDWIERIEQCRGEVSFSDFIRAAIVAQIGEEGLSEVPGWGMGRWKNESGD